MRITCCVLLLLVILSASSCKNNNAVPQSFYYWKTVFRLNECERTVLTNNHIDRIYIRYFDVKTVDGTPMPISTISFRDSIPYGLQVIPVVFIVNRMFDDVPFDSIASLADHICTRIGQINKEHGIKSVPEVQIDCDWTPSTKDKYFFLLGAIQGHPFLKDKLLSVTLRLHQAKYRKQTGIPPVRKVTLMCYNMGKLTQYGDHNSILDANETQLYMRGLSIYPLPADIALPLFCWGVCFDEQRQYRGLINGLCHEDLDKPYFQKVAGTTYRSDTSLQLKGAFIRKGDHIRLEEPSINDIEEVARMISDRIESPNSIIWYHLDSILLRKHPGPELQKVANLFPEKE